MSTEIGKNQLIPRAALSLGYKALDFYMMVFDPLHSTVVNLDATKRFNKQQDMEITDTLDRISSVEPITADLVCSDRPFMEVKKQFLELAGRDPEFDKDKNKLLYNFMSEVKVINMSNGHYVVDSGDLSKPQPDEPPKVIEPELLDDTQRVLEGYIDQRMMALAGDTGN